MFATRQSWPNLKPLPAQRSPLDLRREFTADEYERLRAGFIPDQMEDKWFIFLEEDTLFFHRSWTGHCIFQIRLEQEGEVYVIREAFANRDPGQYSGSYDLYDEKLVMFLIESFLLQEHPQLPLSEGVAAGIATDLYFHQVIGAGQRTEGETRPLTLRGMIGWLWRWLIWLVRGRG